MRGPLRTAAGVVLALAALPVLAVVEEGSITGRVVDEAGGDPIPDARVVVTRDGEPGLREEVTTRRNGTFRLTVLDASRPCLFHIEADGYRPLEASVELLPGHTLRYTFRLSRLTGPSPADVAPYNRAVALFNEGVQALGAGEAAAAEESFRHAIDTHPDLASAHSALAELLAGRGRFDEALEAAQRALERRPGDSRTLGVAFECRRALGLEEAAAATLEELIAAGGDRATAVRLYNRGAKALNLGASEHARELLEQAVALDPELVAAHRGLAVIAQAGGHHAEAAAAAERALALEPGDEEGLEVRYRAYRAAGEGEKAAAALEEYARAHPRSAADALFEHGLTLHQAGETAAAREAFGRAVAAVPDHARSHYMLGLIAAARKENETARRHLERFLALAPDHPDAEAARRFLEEL